MVEKHKTKKRPSLAVISPLSPYPPDSGTKRRIYHILDHLKRDFEITLLAFTHSGEQRESLGLFSKQSGIHVTPVLFSDKKWVNIERILRKFLHLFIFDSPFHIRREPLSQIEKSLSEGKFDYILGIQTSVASYLMSVGDIKPAVVTLDESCLYHLFYERLYKFTLRGITPKRLLAYFRCKKLKKHEKRIAARFEKITAVSNREADRVRELNPQANIRLVPNGVDTQSFKPQRLITDNFDLLFTGDLSYPPNYDAAKWFINFVLPLIRGKIKEARFVHLGKGDKLMCSLNEGQTDMAVSLGYQESIVAAMASSSFFINPMRSGAGTRLKVLEAMALGKIVITTSLGAEGIIREKDALMIADNAEDFASAVCRIYNDLRNGDGSLSNRISQLAVESIKKHYQWNNILKSYADFIRSP